METNFILWNLYEWKPTQNFFIIIYLYRRRMYTWIDDDDETVEKNIERRGNFDKENWSVI